MYLGEITRNVLLSLLDAAPKPLLFNGRSSKQLNSHYGFDTAYMSEVEEAWENGRVPIVPVTTDGEDGKPAANGIAASDIKTKVPDWQSAHFTDIDALSPDDIARLERIRGIIIQRLGLDSEDVSLRDAAIVRWASSLVANRAARLSGCAVAATLVQTERAKLGGGYATDEERISVGVDGRCVQHQRVRRPQY